MENYEKKYKEALEKARQLCVYPTTKPFISDLQDLFPELAEYGGEKIRKALIDGFTVMKESKNCGKTFSKHNIPVEDILDWLERQKSLFSDNEKRDVWEYVEKFKENYGHYPKDADEIGVIVSEMVNKHNKPIVFDGKDQGRYEDIRDILYELLNNDKYTRSAIECDLKWLTERFRYMKPKPKQEWSERDEVMLNDILMCGEHHCYLDAGNIDWLKSLKDRCIPKQIEWSEEMKDAVDAEITKISPNDHLRVVSDVLPLKDESEWGTKVKIIIIKQE